MEILNCLSTTTAKIGVYSRWAVAYIDQGIVDFYFSLIPKARYVARQRWPAHVTVIRKDKERFTKKIKQYDGCEVEIKYNPTIVYQEPYYFLDAWSDELGEIRESVGLPKYREPYNSYHITLGNVKTPEGKVKLESR